MNKIFKIVCPFLCIFLLFGCQKQKLQTYKNPKKEIGIEQIQVVNTKTRKQFVSIPKTNIKKLDDLIMTTIKKQKQVLRKEHNQREYSIHYESYVKDQRYISIKLMFDVEDRNQEQVICIVYDTKKQQQVHIEDLFSQQQCIALSKLAQKQIKNKYPMLWEQEEIQAMSSAAMENYENFLLTKDAFVIIFQSKNHAIMEVNVDYIDLQHDCDLRMEKEAKSVVIPYDELLYEPLYSIDPNKAMVALTFDDGPNPNTTPKLLDVLAKYHANATFFVLGDHVENNADIIRRMVLEGHEVGNHSYHHKQLTKLSKEQLQSEIQSTSDIIKKVSAYTCKSIRPPYGSYNALVKEQCSPYHIVLWDIDPRDWQCKDSTTIVERIKNKVKDGDIILMHDIYKSSVDAACKLIPLLQQEGYQLVSVSDLYKYREK